MKSAWVLVIEFLIADVYTTRSALLSWDNGSQEGRGNIIILPTTGTSVKIRLPFGADIALKLMPAPYGTDPPSGELWKSRMRISFVPRTGQNTAGTCIIASNGDISQKVVGLASVITRFPDAEASMQRLSLDSGDGEWPTIDILRRRYSLIPDGDVYHASGDIVGPFDIVNVVNIAASSVHWSADYGTMDSETGFSSSLTVTTIPSGDEPIIVTATVQLDETFSMTRNATINRCSQHGFSLDSYTVNFAPLPGSNAVFSVTLPGCTHQNDPGWLEAEIVRETTAGFQHVAWVDMDTSTEVLDRYVDTSDLPNQSAFSWDGISKASLPQSEYEEVFTQGNHPFHLAAPAVAVGQPVPPPYVTLAVRLWNPGKTAVIAEANRRIYVPQVVQVKWESEAEALFRRPKDHVLLGQTRLVYSANYAGDLGALMQETLQRLKAYYPASVNVLFVPFFSRDVETTKFLFITPEIQKITTEDDREAYEYGITPPLPSVQRSVKGSSTCFLGSIYNSTFDLYRDFAEGFTSSPPFPIPVTSAQMLDTVCKVSAHEVGHAFGLVDSYYLDGDSGRHNPEPVDIQSNMMNISTDLKWMFNQHTTVGWRTLNEDYLEFVLPVPQ